MPNRFPELVRANIPNVSDHKIAELQALYDVPSNLPEKLAWDFVTDIVFGCNALAIAGAYEETARRFIFSVPPATHGLDLSCKLSATYNRHRLITTDFFFNNNKTTPVSSIETAHEAESVLLQFMFDQELGVGLHLSEWNSFAEGMTTANITVDGFSFKPLANDTAKRCQHVRRLISDPSNGV
jgi:hypothetical protein